MAVLMLTQVLGIREKALAILKCIFLKRVQKTGSTVEGGSH